MPPKPRRDEILYILNKQGFATVKELVVLLRYSSATINRDLNAMEKAGLVKRSYGGVEATAAKKFPPLPLRYDLKKKEKRHIGKAAAAFVEDGDTLFIDASTTTSYLENFLESKKNLHVITNNMLLAIHLSEKGIRVTVTGGNVVERPSMLSGNAAIETVRCFRADKMFFSTGAFNEQGDIHGGDTYYTLHRTMLKCANKVYFLADSDKRSSGFSQVLCTFAEVSAVISDFEFPDRTKSLYPETQFIHVEE